MNTYTYLCNTDTCTDDVVVLPTSPSTIYIYRMSELRPLRSFAVSSSEVFTQTLLTCGTVAAKPEVSAVVRKKPRSRTPKRVVLHNHVSCKRLVRPIGTDISTRWIGD